MLCLLPAAARDRMSASRKLAVALSLGLSWLAGAQARAEFTRLTRVASGFNSSLFVTHAPGDPENMFVIEQRGVIRVFDRQTGAVQSQAMLDISSLVDDTGGEQGLLGLAFHPDFQSNGKFYVNYTHDPRSGSDRTRIDEYTVADPATNLLASITSRRSILEFDQDFPNHNGGWIGFGPNDGYLYIASGDGGSGNDPNNRAQQLNTRLGKMLRIDVDGDAFPLDDTENYRVPESNPFVGDGDENTLDEIWAYGLRNPWRSSFDRATGDLWIGDVGQRDREEINFQPADSSGGENYGWRLREGDIQNPSSVGGAEPADYAPPIYDYVSDGLGLFGGNSTVGGYVYRGPDPDLNGLYFFGDTFPRQIWTFDPSDPDATVANIESQLSPGVDSLGTLVSFGEDYFGNLYLVDQDGDIFRLDTDSALPGDYNGDRMVDGDDYVRWKLDFGSTAASPADGNGDGIVNLADYTVWRDHLGSQLLPQTQSLLRPVPEPACWLMLCGLMLSCSSLLRGAGTAS